MYDFNFALRLAQLRSKKGVSARDMSLSIGQNPGYINNIESGKAMPSMTCFFYICDYLGVSPKDFFDNASAEPEKIKQLTDDLKKLDSDLLENVSAIVKGLIK
ncbi:MAG: helix-turn-helix transcriptional regulator [Oscillospiraceae bacterium]|nr:helix-turn-helix transcriptional regulator [Oscillospiraceae bacterium]